MSGHSKWAQIKRQKGVADARRSATFGKLTCAITIAARQGADPTMNFQLRIAIDKAKAANMPKDNIERAIDRGKGGAAGGLEEMSLEAYGPGGTAYLIEAATDNRNRTISEVRAHLNKFDGKLAESGAVKYLFKHVGQIIYETDKPEELELSAIDAGATDVEQDGGTVVVTTEPKGLEAVRRNLEELGYESNEVGLEWHPTATVPVTDPAIAKKVIHLSEALDVLDDVTHVSSNFDVPAELIE
ncbi:MAG: YebC/PmpR family DNA-binding transcriptional regulator [Candidatus Berkelbacteria bacterium]|nr:MAG: YebC/PmpR family DNA-binding transcriptional regulator [Candidatus Berkelbacteria bacterium]QQG51914.1 MAG: YebC/PmpR family DNA-binding transcriptional regulator [Candidatus Berkelbacteria bacterium]